MTGILSRRSFAVWSIEQVDVILTAPDLRCPMTTSLAQSEVPMGSFESDLGILETELGVVAKAFGEVTDEQWQAPTLLVPLDEKLPHWTVFELAGHFDISIGLTRMLVADGTAGQVGRDRTSFFIFSRSDEAPVIYDYAYTMVEGQRPGGRCLAFFRRPSPRRSRSPVLPARTRSDPATTRSCGWTSSSPAASSRRSFTV